MRALSGQAAQRLMRALHWVAGLVLAVAVVACLGVALLGWRLAQGPLDMPWLAHRIEASVNAEESTTHLAIGGAALAWEGFTQGVDRPVDLRLRGVVVTDSTGVRLISMPRAGVSLSLLGLLVGRIEPRGIEIDDASVEAYRSANGDISLDLGDRPDAAATSDTPLAPREAGIRLAALLNEFGQPASDDFNGRHGRFSQLRRVRIENASVVVVDHQLGTTWRAPHAEIDLSRRMAGDVEGHANLTLAVGDQTAKLTVEAALGEGGKGTQIRAALTPVAPAALARSVEALAPLSTLDAPVGATMTLDLNPALGVRQARVTLQAGAGTLHIGPANVALVGAKVVAAGSLDAIGLESASLSVRGHDGSDVTVLSATGTMQRDRDRVRTRLMLKLDQLAFADLPNLWPQGVGGVTRDWITQNITDGTARNGQVALQMDAQPDFTDATLSDASGTLDGDGLTVNWLRPIPPIVDGVAQLRILDPDRIEIAVASGRQRRTGAKGDGGGLTVTDGKVTIAGIRQHDQAMTIDAGLAGTLVDAVDVLRAPPLNLLDHQPPIGLAGVAGQFAARLAIAMPLTDPPQPDAIRVDASAHLDNVRVASLVAGRDMTQGKIDLKANRDGLTLTGQAGLGGVPATFDAAIDFGPGAGSQVVQTVNVTGQPTAAQLTQAGFNPEGVFTDGSVGVQVKFQGRRDGQAVIAVSADLAGAAMRLASTDWSKAAGAAAQGDAVLRLDHGRLVGIDAINVTGDLMSIQGQASVADGRTSELRVDRFTLGGTSAQGSIRFPGAAGGPIVATISGTTLDLSHRLSYHVAGPDRTEADHASADTGGQAWRVDARFDRALMANAQTFNGLVLRAETDGRKLTRLRFDARTGSNTPILLDIAPGPGGRQLTARTADAGELMRALDVMRTMDGGHLTITGTFDDRAAGSPLIGTAQIENFRIRNAPALARVLQAMTLYGLVNAISGSGLGFDKLIAPFTLNRSVLDLSGARAFNASIGLTAEGRVNLAEDQIDVDGTVVPAYLFNSLLGRVPLLGKLFSPQNGGGLISANYTVRGPLSDPKVSVNPLSALAPGFLRELFKGF